MTCRFAKELIQQGVDGTIAPPERARLDAHLAGCADCRTAWEQQQRLARLARRWVPQAGQTADGGDSFTSQVLARIAARPAPASSNSVVWLPLVAAAVLAALFPLLHGSIPTTVPDVWRAFSDLPGWFLANSRALPSEAHSLWGIVQSGLLIPNWIGSALLAAGIVNAVFYARAAQSRERSLS